MNINRHRQPLGILLPKLLRFDATGTDTRADNEAVHDDDLHREPARTRAGRRRWSGGWPARRA
jgi:hypothetical protein